MESSSMWGTPNARASATASVVFPEPEHPTTATRSISALLFGRPDQDLVHHDPAGLGHGVSDALGDVLGLHDLDAPEGLCHPLENLRPVVEGQLGRGRPGL